MIKKLAAKPESSKPDLIVRLLRDRGGVRSKDYFEKPVLEVSRVFTLDLFLSSLDFPRPARVVFIITQPEEICEWPQLEALEDSVPQEEDLVPTVEDCVSLARYYLVLVFYGHQQFPRMYEGKFSEEAILERFARPKAKFWENQDDFFGWTFIQSLRRDTFSFDCLEEADMCENLLTWIFEKYPEYSLIALARGTTLSDLMLLQAWLIQKPDRRGDFPLTNWDI